jgi:hypothetical protein
MERLFRIVESFYVRTGFGLTLVAWIDGKMPPPE